MKYLTIAMIVGCALIVASRLDAAIIFELNEEISEGTPPAGLAPWLTATIEGGAGSVTLTMDAGGLTGDEFVSQWLFNFDPDIQVESLNIEHASGKMAASVTTGADSQHAGGGTLFDIAFDFPKPKKKRFGPGDVSVYTIELAGIEPGSFDAESVAPGGQYPLVTAALIQGIGPDGEQSGWIATPNPEPSTFIIWSLLGALGLAAGGWRRRR
ncbi:MAG: hypothetical protein ACYSWU_06270 [Planctomycetota bacterium]|jgi:MYXO-CTERM domain-containing protein